ncbi:MAG: YqiA/YcfP family alpha/beta fold hydrolase [Candidatus Kapaibacterium sp.]
MKILYLHGLDGAPREDKNEILLRGGNSLIAPTLDYRAFEGDISLFEDIDSLIKKEKARLIVGSSFGGYMGFYLADNNRIPAILFNPALHSRSVNVPVVESCTDTMKYFILGKYDEIIKPAKTKEWLREGYYNNYSITELDFGHSVPLEIFAEAEKIINEIRIKR